MSKIECQLPSAALKSILGCLLVSRYLKGSSNGDRKVATLTGSPVHLSNTLKLLLVSFYPQETHNQLLISISVTRNVRDTCQWWMCSSYGNGADLSPKISGHMSGKITPRVHWPLCRWTIEPCIWMKHPSAMTEPLFVSATVLLLSFAVLMSFSASLYFQTYSRQNLQ